MSSCLTYVYAAILDVLAYRQRLSEDKNTGNFAFKDSLQNALHQLTNINDAVYNYQAISDTVIMTCSNQDDLTGFMNVLKNIVLAFLKEGLFVRGGVAYSQHFKSSNITYSYAIALAHELESSVALYPRVVIDDNIIKMFENSEEFTKIVESDLICVQNGVHFLNIIDRSNWPDVYGWAKYLYQRDENQLFRREHDFLKHAWFENYLFSSPYANLSSSRYVPTIRQLQMGFST